MIGDLQRALAIQGQQLIYFPLHGVAYYDVRDGDEQYGKEYFDRYFAMARTDIGQKLLNFRLALIHKYIKDEPLVDVGIGSGPLIEARAAITFGFDINPISLIWLKTRSLYVEPWDDKIKNVSFFDSLEHIKDPRFCLQGKRVVFISIPIFTGPEHIIASKHFRPTEHYWYFTDKGLCDYMSRLGFSLYERSDMETVLGREDIGTYVFGRGE